MMGSTLMPFLLWSVLGHAAIAHSATDYQPGNGYVPDAKTAISIAVAVWSPIYGEKEVRSEKPYHAVLSRGVWFVTGSLPQPKQSRVAGHRIVMVGGVVLAEISKGDGRILRVTHGV